MVEAVDALAALVAVLDARRVAHEAAAVRAVPQAVVRLRPRRAAVGVDGVGAHDDVKIEREPEEVEGLDGERRAERQARQREHVEPRDQRDARAERAAARRAPRPLDAAVAPMVLRQRVARVAVPAGKRRLAERRRGRRPVVRRARALRRRRGPRRGGHGGFFSTAGAAQRGAVVFRASPREHQRELVEGRALHLCELTLHLRERDVPLHVARPHRRCRRARGPRRARSALHSLSTTRVVASCQKLHPHRAR